MPLPITPANHFADAVERFTLLPLSQSVNDVVSTAINNLGTGARQAKQYLSNLSKHVLTLERGNAALGVLGGTAVLIGNHLSAPSLVTTGSLVTLSAIGSGFWRSLSQNLSSEISTQEFTRGIVPYHAGNLLRSFGLSLTTAQIYILHKLLGRLDEAAKQSFNPLEKYSLGSKLPDEVQAAHDFHQQILSDTYKFAAVVIATSIIAAHTTVRAVHFFENYSKGSKTQLLATQNSLKAILGTVACLGVLAHHYGAGPAFFGSSFYLTTMALRALQPWGSNKKVLNAMLAVSQVVIAATAFKAGLSYLPKPEMAHRDLSAYLHDVPEYVRDAYVDQQHLASNQAALHQDSIWKAQGLKGLPSSYPLTSSEAQRVRTNDFANTHLPAINPLSSYHEMQNLQNHQAELIETIASAIWQCGLGPAFAFFGNALSKYGSNHFQQDETLPVAHVEELNEPAPSGITPQQQMDKLA